MRGRHEEQEVMLAHVDIEGRVPKDHPLRTIKTVADEALKRLSPEFDRMYSRVGRASVPPERLLKASLLISFYSVRSERAFCEELEYNLLFRWFLDMNLMERSFDPTAFTRNRKRLLEHKTGRHCSMRWCGRRTAGACCRTSTSAMIGRSSQEVPFYFHTHLRPTFPVQTVNELRDKSRRVIQRQQLVKRRRQQPHLLSVHVSKRHLLPSSIGLAF